MTNDRLKSILIPLVVTVGLSILGVLIAVFLFLQFAWG
jgi:flagellar basal body-associated protein FliL